MVYIPNWTELVPAYGRDYKNSKEAREAFLEGRDFILAATGQATSLADTVWDQSVGTQVILRYRRHQSTVIVKLTPKHFAEVGAKKAEWMK